VGRLVCCGFGICGVYLFGGGHKGGRGGMVGDGNLGFSGCDRGKELVL